MSEIPPDARPAEFKAALRRDMLARRARLSEFERAAAATAAATHFLSDVAIAPGGVVSGYWPIRDEIDPRPILVALAERGHAVCLPVTHGRDRPLSFRRWMPGTALVAAGFGTFAPPVEAPELVPDLVILPLVAFDAASNRLGYGAGHYDRTLAGFATPPRRIGLAFALQEVDTVPHEAHDMTMEMIITERGAVPIKGQRP